MRFARYIVLAVTLVCLLATVSIAGEVRVFMAADEKLSTQQLRNKALAEGFAQAVIEEVQNMLPAPLDEVRAELLKEHLLSNVKPYIQGYKINSVQTLQEGVILDLTVKVNKRSLRPALKSMGLFETTLEPQVATIAWPEDLEEDLLAKLQGLMNLTGIQQGADILPSFTLERGPEATFKGRFNMDDQEFVSINKDMSKVWFTLWAHYFNRTESQQVEQETQTLTVGGWFSPDAVLEFDRVLQGWESAVQNVGLVEMDMQTTGVGGVWQLRLISRERLEMMLMSYLPQRGLTYHLSEETTN